MDLEEIKGLLFYKALCKLFQMYSFPMARIF